MSPFFLIQVIAFNQEETNHVPPLMSKLALAAACICTLVGGKTNALEATGEVMGTGGSRREKQDTCMGVEPEIWENPEIIHFNRV